jgi:3-oxoacyl-[acyl-carrier protein] reductase
MVTKIKPEMLEKIVANIPAGRFGQMSEIAMTVPFMIENEFFSGLVIEVDGAMRI